MIVAGNRYGKLPMEFKLGTSLPRSTALRFIPTEVHTLLRGGEGKAIFNLRRGSKEIDVTVTFPFEDDYLSKPYVLADGALIAEARYSEFRYNDALFRYTRWKTVHMVPERAYSHTLRNGNRWEKTRDHR